MHMPVLATAFQLTWKMARRKKTENPITIMTKSALVISLLLCSVRNQRELKQIDTILCMHVHFIEVQL
jgi:hypothetical protein